MSVGPNCVKRFIVDRVVVTKLLGISEAYRLEFTLVKEVKDDITWKSVVALHLEVTTARMLSGCDNHQSSGVTRCFARRDYLLQKESARIPIGAITS